MINSIPESRRAHLVYVSTAILKNKYIFASIGVYNIKTCVIDVRYTNWHL